MGSQFKGDTNNRARSERAASPIASHHISQLERQLSVEIELQARYAKALEEESSVIKKFRRSDIDAQVETRSEIAEKIEVAAHAREALRQAIDSSNSFTLSQIITTRTARGDKARLLKLVSALRIAVEANRTRSAELGRLVQFTQTLVDGSIAILRSAAQPVTRSYGRNRVTVERDAPKNRFGLKITEA